MQCINKNLVKTSLLSNQAIAVLLVLGYCVVYGVTAQMVLEGMQLIFFLSSLIFALSTFYIRDPEIQKKKVKNTILFNQIAGTFLIFGYILFYGVSSIALLNGFKLIFFMSSFVFAISIFYIRDPQRMKESETVSSSYTSNPFMEKNPCVIKNNDLSWLVRELNGSLSTIVGFSELMLTREYSEQEKHYMLEHMYEKAISLSHTLNKISLIVPDSPTNPCKKVMNNDQLTTSN